jgi:hypothetical protein
VHKALGFIAELVQGNTIGDGMLDCAFALSCLLTRRIGSVLSLMRI